MSMFYAFVVLCCFGKISGELQDFDIPGYGHSCPDFDILNDFNLDRLLGNWYAAMMDPPIERWYDIQCLEIDFLLDENNQISMSTFFGGAPQNEFTKIGEQKVLQPDLLQPNKLMVTLKHSKNQTVWILGTDYDSYLVFHGCEFVNGYPFVQKIILTRDITATNSTIEKGLSVIEKYGIPKATFGNFTHTRC